VTMPDLDGVQVIRRLRAQGSDVPVCVLSARNEVDDRVRGLQAGADDYLVKPYAYAELLARVRVILRRHAPATAGTTATVLEVGDLSLDLLKRRVTRGNDRIELTAKEFALLRHLMSFPGEVQSRTALAARVWEMNFDSDSNVVEVAIKRLRGKIDDPYEKKLLHTIRGAGYVLDDARA
jgi:two-component system, OmpR family, copper resistance phosphate regulon response regulator CusR